uniref:SAM-dependent MTase TRM10-type domain-containing protein n=1 Tax=Trichobilharzia regenti TaxID=157069 RepID=A0AA85K2C6_TRIRE|nr:unnamed protein product [Trichobilharzia regenti]
MSSEMSKSYQKKLQKILRKREKRKLEKGRRKAALREKTKATVAQNCYHSKKFQKMEISQKLDMALSDGIKVYIDCSYEALMSLKECNKFAQQLCRLYGANKKASTPLSLHLVNFSNSGTLFQACQTKCDGFSKYKIGFHNGTASSITEDDVELVYLSPDAQEPLLSLSRKCAYVLGCLVDEHILKGRSLQEAELQRCRAVRLPIQEFCDQDTSGRKSSPVLAINHVIDIMLAYIANGGDWKAAIEAGMPKRFKVV